MTITEEILINDEELAVELSGNPTIENDSFAHEFGNDRSGDYFIVEEINYNKSIYTADQNKLIEEYISKHYNEISDSIIDKYKKS